MKRLIMIFNLLVVLAVLAACAGPATQETTPASNPTSTPATNPTSTPGSSPTSTPGTIAGPLPTAVEISNKPHDPNPVVSQDDLAKLVSGNSAFALALYQALGKSNASNLFYSPYSISVALAMAQVGARGNTLQQMNTVMDYNLPGNSLHSAFNALQLALASREKNPSQPDRKDFQLNIANSTWGQAGYQFVQDYLDALAENYGAGLRLVDFKADPESARQQINDWIAEQTANKIQNLVPPGGINALTRLVLANAIYFNAPWLHTFDAAATQSAPFTNLDGKQVSAPVMNQQASFPYAKSEGYQAVDLPYSGDKLSMIVVLPDAGQYERIEKTFTPELVDTIQKDLRLATVKLGLPKFKVESTFSLSDVLQQMGMQDAFNPSNADLSGMDGSRSLYISSVIHKAFVSVDENGTEAAAATVVTVGTTSMPVDVVELKIDRPFIFLIRDNESGTILFIGRVVTM